MQYFGYGPLEGCQVPEAELGPVLAELVSQGLVLEGNLVAGKPGPHYFWGTRWESQAKRQVADARRQLLTAVESAGRVSDSGLDVETAPARAFYRHVIGAYRPPADKQWLVVLQCSVRRPFSTSPSHAAMRRAIAVATGCDPRADFESCPVHVVVLASKIGPVPYELEDVYPASVRGGGVKHYSTEHFARVKPVLAHRMAEYIVTHQDAYTRIATFTDDRYAEVMRAACQEVARRSAGRPRVAILPRRGGPEVVEMGGSRPRQYWAKYWLQLYLEIESWLQPARQQQARARLEALEVRYTP